MQESGVKMQGDICFCQNCENRDFEDYSDNDVEDEISDEEGLQVQWHITYDCTNDRKLTFPVEKRQWK